MSADKWIPENEPPAVSDEGGGLLRSAPVLVHQKSGRMQVARWEIQPGDDEDYECVTGWVTDDIVELEISESVTHWMPLPAPPKVTK